MPNPHSTPFTPRRAGIAVFIAEDHPVTLWGLQRLIEAQPNMRVVGCAEVHPALLTHPALPDADVLMLDLDMGGHNMLEALADVQRITPAKVLILTGETDVQMHRTAVVRGARGVLHKGQSAEVILRAIEKVYQGEVWIDRTLMGEVLSQLTGGTAAPPARRDPAAHRIDSLTPRERQIVTAMVRHVGAKQLAVAEALGMSENTLRNHLTTIYAKLSLRGRLELHLFATEHGLDRDGGDTGPTSGR